MLIVSLLSDSERPCRAARDDDAFIIYINYIPRRRICQRFPNGFRQKNAKNFEKCPSPAHPTAFPGGEKTEFSRIRPFSGMAAAKEKNTKNASCRHAGAKRCFEQKNNTLDSVFITDFSYLSRPFRRCPGQRPASFFSRIKNKQKECVKYLRETKFKIGGIAAKKNQIPN